MPQEVDLFVIGAGSGGVPPPHRVRLWREGDDRGGVSRRRHLRDPRLRAEEAAGLRLAFAEEFEDAAGFGWTVPEPKFDWPTLIANKDREIARLEAAYTPIWRAKARSSRAARCSRIRMRSSCMATGGTRARQHILIATGGAPTLGANRRASSTSCLERSVPPPEMPERMLILGGGYIAVEFAGIFNGLGAE